MTTRSRSYSTEGVVVRQRDIGEADRLLWIITPDHGIIRAVARSARKPGSRLGGHIDLLRHVALSMRTGRSLDQVSQAETVSGFISLRQDLVRATTGSYVAELAERFSVEGGANRHLFELLVSALGYLQTTTRAEWLPRWFELRLLSISGFMPELYACVDCGGELVQEDHVFSSERGGLVCPGCRAGGSDVLLPASEGAIKLLRYLHTADWKAAERLRINDEVSRQTARILRSHMRYVLDHSIRSIAFLDEVSGGRGSGRADETR